MTTIDTGRDVRLTKRSVDAAEPGSARFILWDADLKGFGLRVEPKPSGTKTFIVRYRVGGGRRGTLRQFKIGRYGKLTPDEARDEAVNILAQVELGQDPQAQRVSARETLTVAELCDLYLAEGVATKKASTLQFDVIHINGFIRRRLGNRKITEVTTGDVDRLLNDIANGKLAAPPLTAAERAQKSEARKGRGPPLPPGREVKGGKTAATKSVKLFRAIYSFALTRKICAENPTTGVKTFDDLRRDRFMSPKEMGALGDVLASSEAALAGKTWRLGTHALHIAIIRLLLLTGARKNEIARLRWSEVDQERGLLLLEDSKTGRKAIRLGAAAQEALGEIPRTNFPWVFPDPRDGDRPVRGIDAAWVRLRKEAGLEDVRIHDLRHSFASVAVAGGAGLYLIGKLLGHAHVATTSRYAHLADDPLQDAADKTSRSISAAMGGAPGDVRPMAGAKR